MANKKAMEVLIDGRLYTLATEDSAEFVQRVVNYFNAKITDFKRNPGYKRLGKDYQNVLLSLNIAEDLFKTKEKVSFLEGELVQKEKELSDLEEKFESLQMEYAMIKKMLEERQKGSKRKHE